MMFTSNISNCSNTIVPGPNVTEAEYIQQVGSYCCLDSRSVCDVAVPSSVPSLMLDNSLLCEDPFLYMGNATTPFTGCASGLDLCTSEDEWRCDGLMIQLYDMLPGPIKDCYPDYSDINKMNGEGNMTYAEVIQTYGHFCCKNAFSACGEADSSLVLPVSLHLRHYKNIVTSLYFIYLFIETCKLGFRTIKCANHTSNCRSYVVCLCLHDVEM